MKDWKKLFIIIYTGQAFSLLGSSAVQFAVIWWLTAHTESAVTLTLATIVSFLPNMLLGPFAGVWIDRYNRRTVMIAADSLVAFSSVLLGGVFLVYSEPPVWIIFAVLFIRGVGNTFHAPAMQAAIPLFVPAEMLTKAGGWGNLVTSVSSMLGPALGAGMMTVLPIASIMLIDIVGALFAVACLLMISLPDVPGNGGTVHPLTDMKLGFYAMKENRPLMAVFFPVIFASVLYMPLGSLFPLLVRLHYAGGAGHNALVEFVFSAGLLASSLIVGIWGGLEKRFLMISVSISVLGAAAFLSGILPTNGFWGFAACCFVMGASGTFFNVPLMAHIQETVPPQMMGKVFSMLGSAMTLATPVGLLLAGPVSEAVGVEVWFAGSGVLLAATGAVCYVLTRKYDLRAGKAKES